MQVQEKTIQSAIAGIMLLGLLAGVGAAHADEAKEQEQALLCRPVQDGQRSFRLQGCAGRHLRQDGRHPQAHVRPAAQRAAHLYAPRRDRAGRSK